jgi:hypothetical protein
MHNIREVPSHVPHYTKLLWLAQAVGFEGVHRLQGLFEGSMHGTLQGSQQ